MSEHIEAEVVAPSQALVVVPDKPQDLARRASDVAGLCKEIVLKTAVQIQSRKYVKAEGWLAIATAHGCIASSRDVEKVVGGYRAIGEIRRICDGAILAMAEGFVGEDEPTWFGGGPRNLPKRPDYAIRAMCQTRAISRVCRAAFAHVVVLMDAGLSTTPAEEVPDGGFEQDVAPNRPTPAPAKPAPAKVPPAKPKFNRAEFIAKLKQLVPEELRAAVTGFLKDFTDSEGKPQSWLLPNEDVINENGDSDLQDRQLEILVTYWDRFLPQIEQFISGNKIHVELPKVKTCPNCGGHNYTEMRSGEKVWTSCPDCGRESKSPPSPPKTVGGVLNSGSKDDEAWRDVIVTLPRKGMKRDIYLRKPDTIGSLYDVRHGDDEESQACRQRLWGLVNHFEPKPWTKRDGTEMPPSPADLKLREALDQFADWFERAHPNEKL